MRRETFSLITLLCVGCGDPLAPRQLVEKPRVLAARAETAADAAVATPERGQDAVVRVLLEAPTPLGAVPFALAACERDATLTGVPGCRDELTEVSGAAAEPLAADPGVNVSRHNTIRHPGEGRGPLTPMRARATA